MKCARLRSVHGQGCGVIDRQIGEWRLFGGLRRNFGHAGMDHRQSPVSHGTFRIFRIEANGKLNDAATLEIFLGYFLGWNEIRGGRRECCKVDRTNRSPEFLERMPVRI